MSYIIIFTILILSIVFLYGKSKGIQKQKIKQEKDNNKLKAKYEKINNNDITTIVDKLSKHKY